LEFDNICSVWAFYCRGRKSLVLNKKMSTPRQSQGDPELKTAVLKVMHGALRDGSVEGWKSIAVMIWPHAPFKGSAPSLDDVMKKFQVNLPDQWSPNDQQVLVDLLMDALRKYLAFGKDRDCREKMAGFRAWVRQTVGLNRVFDGLAERVAYLFASRSCAPAETKPKAKSSSRIGAKGKRRKPLRRHERMKVKEMKFPIDLTEDEEEDETGYQHFLHSSQDGSPQARRLEAIMTNIVKIMFVDGPIAAFAFLSNVSMLSGDDAEHPEARHREGMDDFRRERSGLKIFWRHLILYLLTRFHLHHACRALDSLVNFLRKGRYGNRGLDWRRLYPSIDYDELADQFETLQDECRIILCALLGHEAKSNDKVACGMSGKCWMADEKKCYNPEPGGFTEALESTLTSWEKRLMTATEVPTDFREWATGFIKRALNKERMVPQDLVKPHEEVTGCPVGSPDCPLTKEKEELATIVHNHIYELHASTTDLIKILIENRGRWLGEREVLDTIERKVERVKDMMLGCIDTTYVKIEEAKACIKRTEPRMKEVKMEIAKLRRHLTELAEGRTKPYPETEKVDEKQEATGYLKWSLNILLTIVKSIWSYTLRTLKGIFRGIKAGASLTVRFAAARPLVFSALIFVLVLLLGLSWHVWAPTVTFGMIGGAAMWPFVSLFHAMLSFCRLANSWTASFLMFSFIFLALLCKKNFTNRDISTAKVLQKTMVWWVSLTTMTSSYCGLFRWIDNTFGSGGSTKETGAEDKNDDDKPPGKDEGEPSAGDSSQDTGRRANNKLRDLRRVFRGKHGPSSRIRWGAGRPSSPGVEDLSGHGGPTGLYSPGSPSAGPVGRYSELPAGHLSTEETPPPPQYPPSESEKTGPLGTSPSTGNVDHDYSVAVPGGTVFTPASPTEVARIKKQTTTIGQTIVSGMANTTVTVGDFQIYSTSSTSSTGPTHTFHIVNCPNPQPPSPHTVKQGNFTAIQLPTSGPSEPVVTILRVDPNGTIYLPVDLENLPSGVYGQVGTLAIAPPPTLPAIAPPPGSSTTVSGVTPAIAPPPSALPHTSSSGAHGHGVPTEGHDVPTEGHDVPTEGHDVPTEGHGVPTEGHDVPTEGHDVPTEGHGVPTEGHDVTTEGVPSKFHRTVTEDLVSVLLNNSSPIRIYVTKELRGGTSRVSYVALTPESVPYALALAEMSEAGKQEILSNPLSGLEALYQVATSTAQNFGEHPANPGALSTVVTWGGTTGGVPRPLPLGQSGPGVVEIPLASTPAAELGEGSGGWFVDVANAMNFDARKFQHAFSMTMSTLNVVQGAQLGWGLYAGTAVVTGPVGWAMAIASLAGAATSAFNLGSMTYMWFLANTEFQAIDMSEPNAACDTLDRLAKNSNQTYPHLEHLEGQCAEYKDFMDRQSSIFGISFDPSDPKAYLYMMQILSVSLALATQFNPATVAAGASVVGKMPPEVLSNLHSRIPNSLKRLLVNLGSAWDINPDTARAMRVVARTARALDPS
jgi:hypothetical protein